jgi:hypothetical protein
MHDRIAALLSIAIALIVIVVGSGLAISAIRSDSSSDPAQPPDTQALLTALADETVRATWEAGEKTFDAELTAHPLPTETPSASDLAERDASADLPGMFVPSQGSGHYDGRLYEVVSPPYCEGVAWSGTPDSITASTPVPVTPISPGAPSAYHRDPMADGRDCYSSNPPSSGQHLGVMRNVDIGGGITINIPPDPAVYPEGVTIPRASIPHILEHAGVFVGYNCAEGDAACEQVIARLEDLVNERIDDFGERVVMARDSDLPAGTIGLASWTRVMSLEYQDYDEGAVVDFIATHWCRYDPEGFCAVP